MFRYLGFDSPGDLYRPSASHFISFAVPGQEQWPPCWGVFSAPSSSRHGSRPPALPRQMQGQWLLCTSESSEWKCHIKTRWRWFYCQRVVPTEHSDTGGDHEKELWIHIDYQFLPSVPTLPRSLPRPSSPHFLPHSLHPSISDGPLPPPTTSPTHFLPFLSIYASVLSSLPLSTLPQLNAIIVMDFSPSVDGFQHPVLK